ncbi:MAG: hypothetical protein M3Y84_10055 [Acidobacteriota bacterium]|nr:hypothetical protein [Acidobacteriota bacterium]
MKPKTILAGLLGLSALGISCSSMSGLNLDIDTISPQKTYRVIVEGRGDPPSMFSTVQQVKLTALKGSKILLEDKNFYREEVDHLFSAEYPQYEWLNESVLRFGQAGSSQFRKDKLVILNRTGEPIDVLKVEYSILNEKLLVFDLAPGASAELKVILASERGTDTSPSLFFTAYSNGKSFNGVINEWKRGAGTEMELSGEIFRP